MKFLLFTYINFFKCLEVASEDLADLVACKPRMMRNQQLRNKSTLWSTTTCWVLIKKQPLIKFVKHSERKLSRSILTKEAIPINLNY